MKVSIELTYDMAKALGVRRFQVEGAHTVAEAIAQIGRASCRERV